MRAKLILFGFVLVFAGATWEDPPTGLLLLMLLPVIAAPAWRGTAAGLEWQTVRRERLASLDLEARCLAELRRDVDAFRVDFEAIVYDTDHLDWENAVAHAEALEDR